MEEAPVKPGALKGKELSIPCLISKALKFVLLLKAVKFLCFAALQNGSLCCRESGTHGRKLPVQAKAVLI